jgi:hypothetical protein
VIAICDKLVEENHGKVEDWVLEEMKSVIKEIAMPPCQRPDRRHVR